MFNPKSLLKERLSQHLKLMNRYLRYIFNGHFMIALVFIIIALAIYYQRWLQTLTNDFPVALLFGIVLGLLVNYNPIQTFLKEADQVFLIVKEKQMHTYFIWSLIYNYGVQLYVVIVTLVVLFPLYEKYYAENSLLINLLIVVIVLLMKAWNGILKWQMFKITAKKYIISDRIIRLLLSIAVFYFLFSDGPFLLVGLLYIVYSNIVYFITKKVDVLHWEKLIHNDSHRLAVFYRFVSLFAQVPQMKKQLHKRKILASFMQKITPFKQENTYAYMYRLTFVRGGDYLSLYIRLTIVAIFAIWIVSNQWLSIVIALLFIYMTSFQMLTLFFHHRMNIWVDLYPLAEKEKQTNFLQFVIQLTILQTIILGVAFLLMGDVYSMLLLLILGTLFNFSFHYTYAKRKITRGLLAD